LSQPLVAYCVPAYNHGEFIEQCVRSILGQSWPNVEVWISDDCSTDHTGQICKRLSESDTRVHYHRNPVNLGTNANLESLLRRPSAQFIGRVDADDYLAPGHAHTLMELLHRFPEAGYAHSAIQTILEHGQPSDLRKLARIQTFHAAEKSLRSLALGLKMCANMPIYRREALESIEFLRGAPFSGEDYFTACRIADAGWGNAYTSKVLGCYRVGLSSQWSIGRNIKRANGLAEVFNFLESAYQKRGWTTQPIIRSRVSSALNLARNTFGRRGITPELEQQAQAALHRLWPDIEDYKAYVEAHPPGLREWSSSQVTRLKKTIKSLLP
jgi:glycosyltransferase involved in cell wall biosynthesis